MKGSHGVVKIIDKDTVCKNFIHFYLYLRELASIKRLDNHQYIIKLKTFSTTKRNIYLDRYSHDLSHVIHMIPKDKIPMILYQILVAVKYAESHNILHRDLKPHNILVDINTYNIVLCDWSLSRSSTYGSNDVFTNEVQSEMYRAPELYNRITNINKHVDPYGSEIDVWSIGVIAVNMCRSTLSCYKLKDMSKKEQPPIIIDLLNHMLTDKASRYTIDECINHKLFDFYRQHIETPSYPSSAIDQSIYSLPNVLTTRQRKILVEWLFEVQMDLGCSDIAIASAVYYIDLFLSKTKYVINTTKFQLLGISAIVIANNLYDPNISDVNYAIEICDNTYTKKQIEQFISLIIRTLDGNLYIDTEYHYLQMLYHGSPHDLFKHFKYDQDVCDTVVIFSLTDFRFRQYNPNDVANAIIIYDILYRSHNLTIDHFDTTKDIIELLDWISTFLDDYDLEDGIPDNYS